MIDAASLRRSGKPPRARTSPVGRIDPRHEARARPLGSFRLISVAHGHTSAVGLPSIVARDAHAGSGGDRGRRSAISRRISANSVLGTATSAIWKATALAANDHLAHPVAVGADIPSCGFGCTDIPQMGSAGTRKVAPPSTFGQLERLSDGGSQVQGSAGPKPQADPGCYGTAGRSRRMVLPVDLGLSELGIILVRLYPRTVWEIAVAEHMKAGQIASGITGEAACKCNRPAACT